MQVIQTRVQGEDFVGLLGFAADKYAIISPNFKYEEVLDVPTLKTRVYGTNLVGLFCTGNTNGLILPYFISERETASIKSFMKKLDVNVSRIEGQYTAIGNLIACNDHAAVISPDILDVKTIQDTLGVEVVRSRVGKSKEVGGCLVATNKGFLASPQAHREIDQLEKILKVKGSAGTVNRGVGFIRSGLIANSNGYITGQLTTPIELGRIEEGLGLV